MSIQHRIRRVRDRAEGFLSGGKRGARPPELRVSRNAGGAHEPSEHERPAAHDRVHPVEGAPTPARPPRKPAKPARRRR